MPATEPWPTAFPLVTPRLTLEPRRVNHAPEAVKLFNDPRLHTWTGGMPSAVPARPKATLLMARKVG